MQRPAPGPFDAFPERNRNDPFRRRCGRLSWVDRLGRYFGQGGRPSSPDGLDDPASALGQLIEVEGGSDLCAKVAYGSLAYRVRVDSSLPVRVALELPPQVIH